jgi:hypothetical protein
VISFRAPHGRGFVGRVLIPASTLDPRSKLDPPATWLETHFQIILR